MDHYLARPRAIRQNPVPSFETVPLDTLAASIFFFLGVYALGPAATLASFLCFGIIALSRWRSIFWTIAGSWLFLLLPLWAIYSAAWSEVPHESFRYGLQFLLTALMGIFIAYAIPLRRIALVIWAGTFAAVLLGVLSGRTGSSAEGLVLIGLTGSKNQFAYLSLFWLLSSLALSTDGSRSWLIRIFAIACIAPAMYLIYQADATTALVSAICALALFLLLTVSRWLPKGARIFCLCATIAAGLSLAVAAPRFESDAEQFRSDVLQKDATLTGRTTLWEHADNEISEHPLIGQGYKAFWFGDQGSGLLARFSKDDPRAFNFHDTFRDIAVDLGYVGLILFILILGYAVVKTTLLVVAWPDPNLILMMAILLVIGIRTKVELVVGPFALDPVLLWVVLGYAWQGSIRQGHASPGTEPRVPQFAAP